MTCKHNWLFNDKGRQHGEYWLHCTKCREAVAVKLKEKNT